MRKYFCLLGLARWRASGRKQQGCSAARTQGIQDLTLIAAAAAGRDLTVTAAPCAGHGRPGPAAGAGATGKCSGPFPSRRDHDVTSHESPLQVQVRVSESSRTLSVTVLPRQPCVPVGLSRRARRWPHQWRCTFRRPRRAL